MAPPWQSSSSHSSTQRKRKSSENSNEDTKYSKPKIKNHTEAFKREGDLSYSTESIHERRSKLNMVPSLKHSEGRWKHDKWKESNDIFIRPIDRSSRKEDSRRDRRSQSRSDFHRDRHHNEVDDFMDHRRQERERITLVGVQQVWGKSPIHAEE